MFVDHVARELHRGDRAAWLRAGVLGANDGLISTAALMIGVAAADNARTAIITAGVAGLTAGALAMAAGEFVSVSSQRDVERADIERERHELATQPDHEQEELFKIYRNRGLSDELARRVAEELMAHEDETTRLAIHARDELGIDIHALARPTQAAVVSAVSFVVGAVLPILLMAVSGRSWRVLVTMAGTLIGLVSLGAFGAHLGGAPKGRASLRVLIGGALAFAVSVGIGKIVGAAV